VAIDEHRRYLFSAAGDGVAGAFQRSRHEVAVAAQRAFAVEPWPQRAPR
jgi:hypothetical protein